MATGKANVLITCAGRRVELVQAFKSARDALGLNCRVLCADCDRTAPALAFADGAVAMPPLQAQDNYLSSLAAAARDNCASLIIPTIDTELALLANWRGWLEERSGARVVVSSPECVAACADKAETARLLAANGIPHAETWRSRAEAEAAGADFPLIVKPADGSSSQNVFTARDDSELDFFLGYVPNPVVQPMLRGVEYSIDAFLDFESRPFAAVPRVRLATRAGEILKGRIDMSPAVLGAARPLMDALSRMGAVGVVTLQGFLCDDGVFRFTEINPRFGGGAPMSIAAGADFPRWLLMLAAGIPLPANAPAVRDGAVFSRFDQSAEITPEPGAEDR